MITSITGTLAAATPLHATVEINGLGYSVNIPLTTAEKLPAPGATVRLHTLVIYREDSQALYGFATPDERDFFQLMIDNVTGIGPKSALTIMSRLSPATLISAISNGDIATLAKCQGIGKKTAERLVVELRGKLGALAGDDPAPGSSGAAGQPAGATAGASAGNAPGGSRHQRDATLALVQLGYKSADADAAIRRATLALGAGATVEQLIKRALASET
jgi:Holliday junction DNA helicase RuvA